MSHCSSCGAKLGILAGKRSFQGSTLCRRCYGTRRTEALRQGRRTVTEYLTRYFSNKDLDHAVAFRELFAVDPFASSVRNDSLAEVRGTLTRTLEAHRASARQGAVGAALHSIVEQIRIIQISLVILDDLERLRKLLQSKGMLIAYHELISLAKPAAQEAISREIDKAISPLVPVLQGRLRGRLSRETVIKEAFRVFGLSADSVDLMAGILQRFELHCDRNQLRNLMAGISEEVQLERFEETLSSSAPGPGLGDFAALDGHEFERYLAELFRLQGYTVVQLPESRDKGGDLILSKGETKIVVQAKKYSGKVPNKAVQEVVAARGHYQTDKAMVVTTSSFTRDAVELALSNGVELWDGKKLGEIVSGLRRDTPVSRFTTDVTLDTVDGQWKYLVKVKCPVCTMEFERELDIRKSRVEMNCPHCDLTITATTTIRGG